MTTQLQLFLAAVDAGDDDSAEELVAQLSSRDQSALIGLTDDVVDSDRRWWAVRALAMHGTGQAVDAIVKTLDDCDAGVRAAAAMALAYLNNRQPESVNPVLSRIAHLLMDNDGMVRQAATDSLAMCRDDAVDALALVLEGAHQGARTRAMMALRKIATFPAAKVMFQYLNDSNYLVHTYAYEGFDEMGLLENVLLVP